MFNERIEVTVKSSFRRQSDGLETDKDLPDTIANAVEKHSVQLQSEAMSESGGTGNRFRATDHRPNVPERRASPRVQQILQQQSHAHTDHTEFAVAV